MSEKEDTDEEDENLKAVEVLKGFENIPLAHTRTVEEETKLLTGKKPIDNFRAYQDDFVEKCLVAKDKNMLKKSTMKVLTFSPDDDDRKFMFEHEPVANSHVHPYAIKHKEIMFVQKESTQDFFIVVRTIEAVTHNTYDEDSHNLIKTIRIFECDVQNNCYKQIK